MAPSQGTNRRAAACPDADRPLGELWQWLLSQRRIARLERPIRLHSGSRDATPSAGDGVQRHRRDMLGSPAFSAEFSKYLEHAAENGRLVLNERGEPRWPDVRWRSPNRTGACRNELRSAMQRLYSRGARAQSHEYQILMLVIDGGYTDPEEILALFGCRRDFFEAAARRAITSLARILAESVASERSAA